MQIISWNVNGLNACRKKGLDSFLKVSNADMFCLQEIKAKSLLDMPNYWQYWNLCQSRKGYSGTLVVTKKKPLSVGYGIGVEHLDKEGRSITLEFEEFILITVYVPNAESGLERKSFREEWDVAFLEYVKTMKKPLIICGDFNVARETIDIYPENLRNIPNPPGFQKEERSAMEHLLEGAKLFDVYRTLHPDGISYTWWSNRMHKRKENRGWRLDYFLISKELIGDVKYIRHRTDIYGSDHCPVELNINLWRPKQIKSISDENAAEMWRGIDWGNMEQQLLSLQKRLTHAVYAENDEMRIELQKRIVRSMAAKVLAVRHIVSVNSAPGIDGVKWESDEEKMRAAMSLTSKGYHARPYRQIIIEDKAKLRAINIPTAYDKAMQMLYAYALDPVAEATGDLKSFAFRRGRSTFDCHLYICEILDGDDAPEWFFKGDVKSCYDSISHKWLLQNIPMDRKVLSEFLRAGIIMNGALFPTNNGISQGGSLSPIIGNMALDGLQKFIHENLFPEGNIDNAEGQLVRFADDIFITSRSQRGAEKIRSLVLEFLAARGLRLSEEKSKIGNVTDGFAFLSRWYCRKDGYLDVKPTRKAVRIVEEELEHYILNYKGSIQKFINGLNRKLGGWGRYHRITAAYEDFEHIDTVVQSFLLKKAKLLHPKRQLGHITAYYWYKDIWGRNIFADPNNRRISVLRLTDMQLITHKPVKTTFNPYLDQEYYQTLIRRREINRVGGTEYQAIWNRQQGLCFFCGQAMLPDHELEIIHLKYNQVSTKSDEVYVHKRCAYGNSIEYVSETSKEAINLVEVLEEVINSDVLTDDPYFDLRLFFHNCNKSPITLTFEEIEKIIGDELDWEAYFFEPFWYDEAPGFTSELWDNIYPFHCIRPSERKFCIADSWISQGYVIQRLRLAEKRVIFRKKAHGISGINLPRVLFEKKLPQNAVYEIEEFIKATLKKYGIK